MPPEIELRQHALQLAIEHCRVHQGHDVITCAHQFADFLNGNGPAEVSAYAKERLPQQPALNEAAYGRKQEAAPVFDYAAPPIANSITPMDRRGAPTVVPPNTNPDEIVKPDGKPYSHSDLMEYQRHLLNMGKLGEGPQAMARLKAIWTDAGVSVRTSPDSKQINEIMKKLVALEQHPLPANATSH